MNPQYLAKAIDHTLLKPEATQEQIENLCQEADKHFFASVCVPPAYVSLCVDKLQKSEVKVCTVIGFPLGNQTTKTKVFETQLAISEGADEIDMVINIGALKSKDYQLVQNEITEVVKAAHGHTVKVIIETALLTDEEKVKVCELALETGAHFVKTSTGFAGGGATLHDVDLMAKTVHGKMEVKASGGIKDKETALQMLEHGATRLGTSSGVSIMEGTTSNSSY